jgi:hypothetical protein
LLEYACQEFAEYVRKAAVFSEITLLMRWQKLSLFSQEQKKNHYILIYSAPSPGTEVTLSTFFAL